MFLVRKEDYIYDVKSPTLLSGNDLSLLYDLELICGLDYIDTDCSDIQGWIGASNFSESVQLDSITVLCDESLLERLKEEGYKRIDKLPCIHETKK